MKFHGILLILAGLLVGGWGVASADALNYQAYTEYPVKQSGSVSAAGVQWSCAGFKCEAQGFGALGVSQCKALAARIGYIGSFAWGGSQLGAAQLDACNAGLAMGSEIEIPAPRVVPSPRATEPPSPARPVETRHRYLARTRTAPGGAQTVSAGGLRFHCGPRGGCSADGAAAAFSVSTCRTLAARLGHVASFSRDGRPMSASDLAQCNRGLRFTFVAEFGRPVKSGRIDVAGGAWQCRGHRCEITADWEAPTVAFCKSLADRAGATITRFSREIGGELGAGELAQCNRSAGLVAILARIDSAEPLPRQAVIGGVPWDCRRTEGQWECIGRMSREGFLAGFNIGACRQLAARLGPVLAFGEDGGVRQLVDAQLAQCNQSTLGGQLAAGVDPGSRVVDGAEARRGIGGALVRRDDGSGYGVASQPLTAADDEELGVLRQAMLGNTCLIDPDCGTGRCREGFCAPEDGEGASPWEFGDAGRTDYCHHDNHCGSNVCVCDDPDHKDGGFCRANGKIKPGKCSAHTKVPLGQPCNRKYMCARAISNAAQCVQGKCAPEDDTGTTGMYCHHNNHCISGKCIGNQCQSVVDVGGSCKKDHHCRGGNKEFWGSDWTARCERGKCVPRDYVGANGDFCQHDNHCASMVCAQNRCFGGALPLGAKCKKEEQCAGGNRRLLGDRWSTHCPQGRCAPRDRTGNPGTYCHHDNHCTQGLRCKCPGRGRYGERFLNGVCIRTDDPSNEDMQKSVANRTEFVCRI